MGLFVNRQRTPGGDDSSPPQFLAVQPSPQSKVYDLDLPGTGLVDPSVPYRIRYNFIEYAVLGNAPGPPGASTGTGVKITNSDFPWWTAVSCTQDNDGNLLLATEVSGDNGAGSGKTKITWNLQ